jgi:hypothetical protein
MAEKPYNPPISGYKSIYEFNDYIDEDDLVPGYCSYGELDLADMFAPFEMPNYGLPGGACTVDDFTVEGVMDAPFNRKQTSVRKLSVEDASTDGERNEPGKRQP